MAFLLTPDNAQYKLDKKEATTWKSIKVQIYHAANDTFVWCTCTCIQTENSYRASNLHVKTCLLSMNKLTLHNCTCGCYVSQTHILTWIHINVHVCRFLLHFLHMSTWIQSPWDIKFKWKKFGHLQKPQCKNAARNADAQVCQSIFGNWK